MMKRKTKLFTMMMVLVVSLTAAPVLAGAPKLEGSWEVVAVDDATANEVSLLATYEKDGTLISSGAGPTVTTSNGQGVWSKTRARGYSTRSVILSFDGNGVLVLKAVVRSEVEVSRDGATYEGAFQVDIIDPSTGSVLASNTGTEFGTRIALD